MNFFDGCFFDETFFDASPCVTPVTSNEPNRRRARTMTHIAWEQPQSVNEDTETVLLF